MFLLAESLALQVKSLFREFTGAVLPKNPKEVQQCLPAFKLTHVAGEKAASRNDDILCDRDRLGEALCHHHLVS